MSDSQLKQDKLAELLERLMSQGHRTFKDEYGTPHHSIETGLDEAFLIDSEKRDALLKADPRSEEVLKPYLSQDAISNWRAAEPDTWLIHMPTGSTDIEDYPAIKAHLMPYQEQLEKRSTAQKWYELLRCFTGKEDVVGKGKLVLHHTEGSPTFTHELKGGYFGGVGWLPFQDYFLLGSLNSKLYRLMLQKLVEEDEASQALKPEHFERLPFPIPPLDNRGNLGQLAEFCQGSVEERVDFRRHVSQEMANNLTENGAINDLSEKLLNWHFLNILSLNEESERLFGKRVPEDMVPVWENFLIESKSQLNILDQELDRAAQRIDQNVYQIFELTEEDIEFLENL